MDREKKHLIARVIFAVLLVAMMAIVTATKNDKLEVLAEDECIRDYPFEWTEDWN